MTRELHWMDLLAVGMARYFLWDFNPSSVADERWNAFYYAQDIYRAYCAYEDDQLRQLGAMNIHQGACTRCGRETYDDVCAHCCGNLDCETCS